MKAKKSKLRTVFGRNRNDAIHANNGIMYKLTNPLFEEAVGYYLLEQISTWRRDGSQMNVNVIAYCKE